MVLSGGLLSSFSVRICWVGGLLRGHFQVKDTLLRRDNSEADGRLRFQVVVGTRGIELLGL